MKKSLLFATAILALASCTSETYLGTEEELATVKGEQPISFGTGLNAVTRADKTGAAAAADLNEKFFVYGIKKESVDGAGNVQSGNLVYNNYVVAWVNNSANTTTSNTKGWEYVGQILTDDERDVLDPSGAGTAAQTIKYWDYGAADYTFYAFSADPDDISGSKITAVAKVQDQKTTDDPAHTVYDNGYTVTLAADANLDKLFFSERTFIQHSTGTNRYAENAYGGNVTFRFHNTSTKVRVAMYETIPGHTVTINKFTVDSDGANPGFSDMVNDVTTKFAANLQYCPVGTAGTLTVTYDPHDGTATHNWPVVSFTGTKQKVLELGDGLKAGVTIGTSKSAATYDTPDGSDEGTEPDYTSVFPNETNAQNLKLKLSYTLTADVTGETITVTNATAEIPAAYLKWKPGFAYTYIFKISDNTNGSSGTPGTDPAGLYPITFDAVEMIAEDGSAEYITTVSEPTITTFGAVYNTDDSKYTGYQTGKNEYQAQTTPNQLDIFATFTEGSTVKTPTVGSSGAQHVNVFKVTTVDATNFPITEASVAEAIANPAMVGDIYTYDGSSTYTKVTDATTITAGTTYYKADGSSNAPGATGYTPTAAVAGTDYKVGAKFNITDVTADGSVNFSAVPKKVETVPGEDGINITIDALKLTGVKAGTYAIEYEASAAWTGSYTKVYKVIVVQ